MQANDQSEQISQLNLLLNEIIPQSSFIFREGYLVLEVSSLITK